MTSQLSPKLRCLILSLNLLFVGCLEGTAKFNELADGEGVTNAIQFYGIDGIDQISDVSAKIRWTHVPQAVGYDVYQIVSDVPVFVSFVSAPTSEFSLTDLQAGTTYTYRVNARSEEGLTDSNRRNVSFSTLSNPESPRGLIIASPMALPAFDYTPRVEVSGVRNGNVIRLFSDATCTAEIGSETARGSTVEIVTSKLTPGTHTFYANATNSLGLSSSCSTASVSYTFNECPTGFVLVPGDATLLTTDFCVMQYEARAWYDINSDKVMDISEIDVLGCGEADCSTPNWATVPGHLPVSVPANLPWRRVSQIQSLIACDALNEAGDTNFALINNPEWMTIARNIESNPLNWTGGAVGNGLLFQGNNGTNSVSGYNGADPEGGPGRNTKARHILTTGSEVWDLSGNLWEWVDWVVPLASKAYVSTDGGPSATSREFTALNRNVDVTDVMSPITWRPINPTYSSAQGIGMYIGGSGNTALRGGRWSNNNGAGIYALSLGGTQIGTNDYMGFRCVYRP